MINLIHAIFHTTVGSIKVLLINNMFRRNWSNIKLICTGSAIYGLGDDEIYTSSAMLR